MTQYEQQLEIKFRKKNPDILPHSINGGYRLAFVNFLIKECETVWMENSRYYGAGRLVNGEWFTHDGNEVNAPWRWLSISKENKNENNIN